MDSSQTTSSGSHNRKGQMTNINGTERRIETSKEPTTPVKVSQPHIIHIKQINQILNFLVRMAIIWRALKSHLKKIITL